MVEPRQVDELPELSKEAKGTTLGEIGELTLKSADTDTLRTLSMWKSTAAKNVQESSNSPNPPEPFKNHSIDELRQVSLSTASNNNDARLRLLAHYISEDVL